MAIEIEAKFKVDSHDAVRSRLHEMSAICVGWALETNHIFDDRAGGLLATDRGLRVRSCHDRDGNLVSATLTYKGARQAGAMKQREELEVHVDDPDGTCAILSALGFQEAICFEKRRETWRLGDCSIELDELPAVGFYVEIEGPDERRVGEVQRTLSLADALAVQDTYVAMMVRYCAEQRLSRCIQF